MKKIITFIIATLFTGPLYCQKKTDDQIDIEDRKLPIYETVEVSGAYHLVLTQDEIGTLKVKGQKEILPYLKTSVSNKVLYVSIDNKYKLKTSLIVYIPINTSLKKIIVKGAVDISTQEKLKVDDLQFKIEGSGDLKATIEATSLDLQVAGAGNINITGTTNHLNAVVKGAGNINSKNLIAKQASLRIAGAGSISAYATDEIDASIAGAGNITIKGNPPVFKKSVKGIGRIKIEK